MSERFSKLKYPIHEHLDSDQDLPILFPELWKYKEFRDYGFHFARIKQPITEEGEKPTYKDMWVPNPDVMKYRRRTFAYMIFLLDPLSDLIDEFDDLKERKEAAAIESGFSRNSKEEWPTHVISLFEFQDDQFTDMCFKFLKIFKSVEWIEICLLQVELDRNNRIRWKGIKGKSDEMTAQENEKNQKLRDFNRDIIAQLRVLKESFVYGETALKEVIEEEMITPENAMRLMSDV